MERDQSDRDQQGTVDEDAESDTASGGAPQEPDDTAQDDTAPRGHNGE
jgi:hypothetical protein